MSTITEAATKILDATFFANKINVNKYTKANAEAEAMHTLLTEAENNIKYKRTKLHELIYSLNNNVRNENSSEVKRLLKNIKEATTYLKEYINNSVDEVADIHNEDRKTFFDALKFFTINK